MTFRKGIRNKEDQLSEVIVDAAFQVHNELGPGLLESVYEVVLAHELNSRGLNAQRQVPIPVKYKNFSFDEGFRADIIVDNAVLVELKSIERLAAAHKKQVLTYLKMASLKLGFLMNYGEPLFKNGVFRIVNGLVET